MQHGPILLQSAVEVGETLWRNYGKQVAVEFPSPKTGGKWQLTAQGWVGYIPLSKELGLAMHPKVPLSNLFRMLEYAYRLESFKFLDDLFEARSLEEFYNRLARILAKRGLDRARKGFHRAYVAKKERLPYVRGRLNVRELAQAPWDVNLQCHYQEHTADVEDNQILASTLFVIARSGLLTERTSSMVRQAYRSLQGFVTLRPFGPSDCVGRAYTRLNDDYQPMHALCRFFLEHSGPSHEMGDRTMLPFLVDMARLYELFVAEWLRAHPPQHTFIKVKEPVHFDGNAPSFEIDLVLYDTATAKALYVMDTKYKAASAPSSDDLAQVVAYAEAKGCGEAVLVYPSALSKPLDTKVGGIRIRSSVFSLGGVLDQSGRAFVQNVLQAEDPGWVATEALNTT